MAKKVVIAASGRRCGGLPTLSPSTQTDAAVISYLNQVTENVADRHPDLILFPEMADMPDGWSMDDYFAYIRRRGERVLRRAAEAAKQYHTWIAFCTIRKTAQGALRNSCLLFDRNGNQVFAFDKLHPTLGELEQGVEPGDGLHCFDCELGRIAGMICFDANDLGAALALTEQHPDCILFPALFHGGLLQQFWAVASGAYLISACGGCGAGAVSPLGQVLVQSNLPDGETVISIGLDYAVVHLDFNTEKLRKAAEKYRSFLTITPPDKMGAVLVTSVCAEKSTAQILREFGIEPRDAYLRRAFECAACHGGTK